MKIFLIITAVLISFYFLGKLYYRFAKSTADEFSNMTRCRKSCEERRWFLEVADNGPEDTFCYQSFQRRYRSNGDSDSEEGTIEETGSPQQQN